MNNMMLSKNVIGNSGTLTKLTSYAFKSFGLSTIMVPSLVTLQPWREQSSSVHPSALQERHSVVKTMSSCSLHNCASIACQLQETEENKCKFILK